jgi:hypothetical protein
MRSQQFVCDSPVFRSIVTNSHCAALSLDDELPPFPPGNYLEPFSHFKSEADPRETLGRALNMLQGFGCDCQFEVVNWRIRCSLYSSHDSSELRFFVSIFRSPQPGQFVVEMQKRVVGYDL